MTTANWWSVGISLVSIVVAGVALALNLFSTAGTYTGSITAAGALCERWTEFVLNEQERAAAAGADPSEVDQKLTMLGQYGAGSPLREDSAATALSSPTEETIDLAAICAAPEAIRRIGLR
ncbi:hypothetical protein SAMN04489806_1097 [Paramicrobacterium humi]|uniref:Uncharacterized protein n=1 Tax=Paramicrobacterium humi TaxID=640635 RepID=A0A1H4KAV7_9MICO|nr:hypothetical protein SAMN04489806_1097 [Microbacterium humi]